MRLAREWAGRTHEVVVIESCVVYEGTTYGSLSEPDIPKAAAALHI